MSLIRGPVLQQHSGRREGIAGGRRTGDVLGALDPRVIYPALLASYITSIGPV